MNADVSLQDLVCLDTLSWLGNGIKAAETLHLSPSSISRRSRGCAEELGVSLQRGSGRVKLEGGQGAINAMRTFLGQLRLLGKLPLRLESHVNELKHLRSEEKTDWQMHLIHVEESPESFATALNRVENEILDFALLPRIDQVEEMLNRDSRRHLAITTFYGSEPIGPLVMVSTSAWNATPYSEKVRNWLLKEIQFPRCQLPE